MTTLYNEFNPFAAQWLKNLIEAGHISKGVVDARPIQELKPDDLAGFDRGHFFAGIAGWDFALSLAGWPDDREVWTGSCPCQSFSSAGKQKGFDDPRHLWPEWFRLIRDRHPRTIMGEQVASAIGKGWLDLVCDDLGREGYTVWPMVLPACCAGAPHLRQRLWFVADAESQYDGSGEPRKGRGLEPSNGGDVDRVADARYPEQSTRGSSENINRGTNIDRSKCSSGNEFAPCGGSFELANAKQYKRGQVGSDVGRREKRSESERVEQRPGDGSNGEVANTNERPDDRSEPQPNIGAIPKTDERMCPVVFPDSDRPSPWNEPAKTNGHRSPVESTSFWSDLEWLKCIDGKARPTQSTLQCLVAGLPDSLGYVRAEGDAEGQERYVLSPLIQKTYSRVGRLKAYGNSIVPQVAAEVIKAYMAFRGIEPKFEKR